MKNKRKKLFLFFIVIFLQNKLLISGNVFMIFDSGFAENYRKESSGFLRNNLLFAIKEKAYPILVSSIVLHNYFNCISEIEKELKKLKEDQKIDFFNYLNLCKDLVILRNESCEFNRVWFKYFNLQYKDLDRIIFFDQLDVNTKKLILLNEQIELLIKNLTRFINLSKNSLYQYNIYYQNKIDVNDWDIYKAVKDDFFLLVPKSIAPEDFNVKNSKIFKKIEKLKELEDLLNDRYKGFREWAKYKIYYPFKKVSVSNIKEFFSLSEPLNIYIAGHGSYLIGFKRIAGLSIDSFEKLIEFFGLKLKSLAYLSCFSGGLHAKKIGDFLNILEKKGKIKNLFSVCFCITNASNWNNVINFPKIINYFNYIDIDSVKKFVDLESQKRVLLESISFKKNGFDDYNWISSCPLVRLPGQNFKAMDMDGSILIVDDNVNFKEIIISENKRAVLLYKKNVSINFDFGWVLPSIIGMIPENGIEYKIKEIKTNRKFDELLKISFLGLKEAYNRKFNIEKLECDNYEKSGLPGKKLILKNFKIDQSYDSFKLLKNFKIIPDGEIKVKANISFDLLNEKDQILDSYYGYWQDQQWERINYGYLPNIKWKKVEEDIIWPGHE